MSRINRAPLALFLIAVVAVLAGAALAKGGFFIGKHEGDTLHVLQIVTRMAQGQWPHLDFQTPIGLFAFAPISLMLKAGLGPGHAILAAQALVAVLLLPAIWYVAASRFRGWWAWGFGGAVLVLELALVHGDTEPAVSISMHYNRWAWALTWLVLATVLVPPLGRPRPRLDGLVVGLGAAALMMIKMTYLAAFAPAVLVALIARKSWGTLGVATLAGLAVMAAVTLAAGTPVFWLAYLRDLFTVMASEVRPQPGLPLGAVVGAPAYMAGSLVLVAAVILLRQSGRAVAGLTMLVLVPAFFYVTYQNFGNDPQWLGLLGFVLVALAPAAGTSNRLGWDMRGATLLAATLAFAFALPSGINLAYSPFRHLALDTEKYSPLVPVWDDLQAADARMRKLDAKEALDLPGSAYAPFAKADLREDELTEWRGEALPACSLELGVSAWFEAIAADLKASGLAAGHTAFTADILSSFWLYGAFDPLPGASPWYYGGLPGWDRADYLLVPLCPLSSSVRKLVLEAVDEKGATLEEVRRNEMYALYRIDR